MIVLKKNCICSKGCTKVENGLLYLQKEGEEQVAIGKGFPNCCPVCGSLFPYIVNHFKQHLNIRCIHKQLKESLDLFFLSQHEAAVREAIVVLEEKIRKLSKIKNETGHSLVSKAFYFEIDKSTKQVITKPKIAINDLKNTSEQNEQEGLMLMLMGFFKGIRNIYQHRKVSAGIFVSFDIIMQVSFYLETIDSRRCLTSGKGCECALCKEINKAVKENKKRKKDDNKDKDTI